MIPEDVKMAPEDDLPEPMYRPDTTAQSIRAGLYSWLQPFLFALSVLFVVSTFFGRLIGVEGDSMNPTLHNKDMLVLQSIAYTPRSGDIVVLTQKSFRSGNDPIVKRVIATEGQSVAIDYSTSTLYVDGVAVSEPYLGGRPMLRPDFDHYDYPITVPQGHIFVLGDNRNNSTDSRSPEVGLVDTRCVLGRAVWRLYPFGGID